MNLKEISKETKFFNNMSGNDYTNPEYTLSVIKSIVQPYIDIKANNVPLGNIDDKIKEFLREQGFTIIGAMQGDYYNVHNQMHMYFYGRTDATIYYEFSRVDNVDAFYTVQVKDTGHIHFYLSKDKGTHFT